ncbi:MAG: hypothetical protein V1738_01110 [Patescibacteria group bacterium]
MDKTLRPQETVSPEIPKPFSASETEPSRENEKNRETSANQTPESSVVDRQIMPGNAVLPNNTSTVSTEVANRDPLLIAVERELEDGLWDEYRELPIDLRSRFKAEGERIAQVVRDGIATGRLTARRVVEMITDWLKMIPHVNKWFLRQEAKIKADALLRVQREHQDRNATQR